MVSMKKSYKSQIYILYVRDKWTNISLRIENCLIFFYLYYVHIIIKLHFISLFYFVITFFSFLIVFLIDIAGTRRTLPCSNPRDTQCEGVPLITVNNYNGEHFAINQRRQCPQGSAGVRRGRERTLCSRKWLPKTYLWKHDCAATSTELTRFIKHQNGGKLNDPLCTRPSNIGRKWYLYSQRQQCFNIIISYNQLLTNAKWKNSHRISLWKLFEKKIPQSN